MERTSPTSMADDLASAVSHGLGAGLAVAALSVLVAKSGDAWRIVSFSVYGATLILLYLVSSFYHGVRSPVLKKVFQRIDHAAIFLLIAGTYTPFTLVSLRGPWGWTLFGLVWGLALCGTVLTAWLQERWSWLRVCIYVAMGWIVVLAAGPLVRSLPFPGLVWLVAGGVAYTAGLAFFVWRSLPFHHAIWHLFVLAGSICHFVSLYLYVLPA